jgi:hypothetical protein
MNKTSNQENNQVISLFSENNQPLSKSRRLLLKLMGLGAGITAGKTVRAADKDLAQTLIHAANYFADTVSVSLYRPQDLLELQLVFTGFQKSSDSKSLTRTGSPNYLVVHLQPQSIAEQAFEEGGGGGEASFSNNNDPKLKGNEKASIGNESLSFPAKTYLSGKSRLVFEIPSSLNTIPLTAKDLLNWDSYKPVVNKRATTALATPVFNVQDEIGQYNNILIKDVKVTEPKITQPANNNPPATNHPALRTNPNIRLNQPAKDTARQVQVNRDIRAATKDEQKVITAREAPKEITRNDNTGLAAAVQHLKIGKTPRPVDNDETSIEFPYRLFISPNQHAAWYHEFKLKPREDLETAAVKTYELWHSRLACKNCDGEKDLTDATKSLKSVRALWGVDINGDYKEKPVRNSSFKTSLYNDDRHCIVHESSNWAIPKFTPKPVQVHNLMLSVLGAWFDAEMLVKRKELENAGIIGSLNLLKWKHIATLARDHYVEVVYAGNMLPFGHEASLVRITERKPQQGFAVNRQRYFIVINEEEKKYNPYNPSNGNFKSFNFSTIKFATTATPTIDPPSRFCSDVDDPQNDHQFVPKVGGKEFLFKLIGYDLEGNEVDFEMPLVFVTTDVTYTDTGAYNLANIGKLNTCYNTKKIIANKIGFRNQKMALTRSHTAGDTMFEVQSITFYSHGTVDEAPGFRPQCKELEIFISAVENITGKRAAQRIELVDDELNKSEAQRSNKGKVFAKLIDAAKVDFNGSGNKTGGSLSPNFSITGLSKTFGAVGGDINQLKGMNFDPAKFFDSSAKLFGVIELGKIIKAVNSAAAFVNGESVQSPIPALKNIETKDALITQYVWNAASLAAFNFGFVKFNPKSGEAGKIKIETSLYRYKDPAKQNALLVNSHIDDFAVEIAGLAAVDFKRVGFTTGSNAKIDFTVDMAKQPLRFLGALTFVNDLQKFIPADGFSDPPFLDITTSGVTSGFTLALPDIQLGAFTLRNVNLGAAVHLPFTGGPLTLRFSFCEKQQPFTLTVSALGGGGFFAIEFDMKGLRSLEAALEFGAAASINLGVASGAVSIMGGIYFKMMVVDGANQYELQGYVRINGALSVLGLITVSVEFLLALTAEIKKVAGEDKVSRVWGEASLKVKIEIFMFSKTVSIRTQREFAGAGADPTFTMMISDKDWEQYCDSFAA